MVDKTAVQHVILTRMGDQLSTAKGTVVNFVVKYIKRLVPKYHLPDAISFRSALHNGYRMQYVKPELVPEDLAFLQYTGGTTGVAKGAMLTLTAICWRTRTGQRHLWAVAASVKNW